MFELEIEILRKIKSEFQTVNGLNGQPVLFLTNEAKGRIYSLVSGRLAELERVASLSDQEIKQWVEDDFELAVWQNAHTIGTPTPTYFYIITNLRSKTLTGHCSEQDWNTVDEAEDEARAALPGYQSKRAKREARQAAKFQPPPKSS